MSHVVRNKSHLHFIREGSSVGDSPHKRKNVLKIKLNGGFSFKVTYLSPCFFLKKSDGDIAIVSVHPSV